ncbi:DUF4148 domain-containing protein [Paraburkholderia jirisanensis]
MKNRFTPGISAVAVTVISLFAGMATPAQAAGLTRAEVRAELAQLRAAGYDQSVGEDVHYPDAVQRAQARVNASRAMTATATAPASGNTSYGGSVDGTSVSSPVRVAPHLDNDGMKPIYFGQ